MITSVHHAQISIPIGAEAQARKFYIDVLGLIEIPKPDSLAGRGGFWMELDGFQIHVGTEDDVDRPSSKAHIAYLVTDLNSWRERLGLAGCTVSEGIPIPKFRRFEFRDPFGNRIEFLEAAGY